MLETLNKDGTFTDYFDTNSDGKLDQEATFARRGEGEQESLGSRPLSLSQPQLESDTIPAPPKGATDLDGFIRATAAYEDARRKVGATEVSDAELAAFAIDSTIVKFVKEWTGSLLPTTAAEELADQVSPTAGGALAAYHTSEDLFAGFKMVEGLMSHHPSSSSMEEFYQSGAGKAYLSPGETAADRANRLYSYLWNVDALMKAYQGLATFYGSDER